MMPEDSFLIAIIFVGAVGAFLVSCLWRMSRDDAARRSAGLYTPRDRDLE